MQLRPRRAVAAAALAPGRADAAPRRVDAQRREAVVSPIFSGSILALLALQFGLQPVLTKEFISKDAARGPSRPEQQRIHRSRART